MTSPISPVSDQSQGSTADASSLGTAGLLDPSQLRHDARFKRANRLVVGAHR